MLCLGCFLFLYFLFLVSLINKNPRGNSLSYKFNHIWDTNEIQYYAFFLRSSQITDLLLKEPKNKKAESLFRSGLSLQTCWKSRDKWFIRPNFYWLLGMLKLYLPPVNSVYKLWYCRPKITKNLAEYLTRFPPVIVFINYGILGQR